MISLGGLLLFGRETEEKILERGEIGRRNLEEWRDWGPKIQNNPTSHKSPGEQALDLN